MSTYQLGIRKNVENGKSLYWLMINATPSEVDDDADIKEKIVKTHFTEELYYFKNSSYWKVIMATAILLDVFITLNYFIYVNLTTNFVAWVVVAHSTCIMYWMDFIMNVTYLAFRKNKTPISKTKKLTLVIDSISLLPISAIYLMTTDDIDRTVFFACRCVTLLRFYQIPFYLWRSTTAGKQDFQAFILSTVIYLWLSITIFAAIYAITLPENQTFIIKDWNASVENTIIVSIYFSVVTHMNTGLGDILPVNFFQVILCTIAMIVGFTIITGVLTAAIASHISSKEIKRELYRTQRMVTMNTLKYIKIEKSVVEKLSENLSAMWKYKKGNMTQPPIDILPLSLQKEIFFDINFAWLNRSLIFSMQPRSFLRSVCLRVRNWSFLPGEVIMEPFGMPNVMLCITSGVIEILSEENQETVLFSLREGSVLGEAKLFISIPTRCVIRASTYVEIQVLIGSNFTRLALKFPGIYRSMREEIHKRIDSIRAANIDNPDFREIGAMRRNSMKAFLQELRNYKKPSIRDGLDSSLRGNILSLYVISENIPRVKVLPVELIRKKPWILRPRTPLIKGWKLLVFLTSIVIVILYPILASFVRKISATTNVLLFSIQFILCLDLVIQCLTAIEKDDKYTYVTSVKKIMSGRLKMVGFYVDVLAALDLTAYKSLFSPRNQDYACLVLSQNKNFKIWYTYNYFMALENRLDYSLAWVRGFKYLFYICVSIIWSAALAYWEACPGEQCIEERWFAQLEKSEVDNSDPSPATEWPLIVSIYYSTILTLGVGYGDIFATSIADCIVVILSVVIGTIIVNYCLSEATTTSKYSAVSRSDYQTEIFAVDRFMKDHELPEALRQKIRDYFQLQWTYDNAFSLKHNTIKARLTPQEREIIIKEVIRSMLTVPLFQDSNTNFLRILAKSTSIRVLPPNQIVIKTGNYRQPMYILERGYCEVTLNEKRYVFGPVTPFGYVEMILGIPIDIIVKTLTHCKILSLTYSGYLLAATKHPSVRDSIDEKIKKDYTTGTERGGIQGFDLKHTIVDQGDERTLTKQKEILSKSFINVCKYKSIDGQNYWEPFEFWGRFHYFRFLLLPFVITPNSLFLKIWMSIRIFSALLVGVFAPVHFSIPSHTEELFKVIIMLQIFACIDMYLMFHVGYYDERGILMFHPAKTALYYLKGNFILDVISIFPFYTVLSALFAKDDNTYSYFYKTPGLIMVLQCYKFSQACFHLEKNILRQVGNIRAVKFLTLTLILANLITGMMILLECSIYTPKTEMATSDLEKEFHLGITVYCKDIHYNITTPEQISPLKFYLISFYWVIQTLTSCGFGDLHAHDPSTMVAIIIIAFVGIFIFCYMFANMTSCLISVHIMVTKYRSEVLEMTNFMKNKNVNNSIQRRLILHYGYNWQRTEGENPQLMLTYLNSRLRQSILTSLYGSVLKQVPAFLELEDTIFQIIGKHLQEIYFLRGETIVKHNDIQEYIYLIYTGKVKVLNKTGDIITVMGSGGLFGNISNKTFSLSSVAVVATENIDVLELNTETFFKALQDFPRAKSLIEFLTSKTTDYIEPVVTSTVEKGGKVNVHVETHTDTIPFEITMSGSPPTHSLSDIWQPTSRLHFRNSIFTVRKPSRACFILPESWLHGFIGVCVLIMAYLSCVITLYRFAFQDYSLVIYILTYFLDFLFFIKISLQFCISYFDKNKNYVISMKKIRNRYFSSKKTIGFDIASNLPLDFFALIAPTDTAPMILSLLRLNRLLRLSYILEFYKEKFKVLMINKIYLELSRMFVCITMMIHTYACCWYFVACPLGHCRNPSWVQTMSLENEEKWKCYMVSFYYVIYSSTTTGYGDVNLRLPLELVLSIIFMVTSRFFFVLISGSLGSVINAHQVGIYAYQEKILSLKSFFIQQRLSEHQLTKMWNYVTSLWIKEQGKQIPEFISMAPHSMKCDVMNAMFGSHLSQSSIFYNLNENFIRQLAICFERFVYFPSNYIVQQGDIDQTMYFIHQGELSIVSVLTIHLNLKETIHFTLQGNDHFGMEQGLISGKAHPFTYRAKTNVEILCLNLRRWQHLLKYFPEVSQKINYRVGQLTLKKQNLQI